MVVWGTGTPRREFLYVDDMADACVHLMKTYSGDELVNIGTGEDISIAECARVVAATVGYVGAISFDASRPDGTARKLLDVSRLANLGWRASTSLALPCTAEGPPRGGPDMGCRSFGSSSSDLSKESWSTIRIAPGRFVPVRFLDA